MRTIYICVPRRQRETHQTGNREKTGQTHKDRTLPAGSRLECHQALIHREKGPRVTFVIHKHLQPPPALDSLSRCEWEREAKQKCGDAPIISLSGFSLQCSAEQWLRPLRLCLCDCHPDWFLGIRRGPQSNEDRTPDVKILQVLYS